MYCIAESDHIHRGHYNYERMPVICIDDEVSSSVQTHAHRYQATQRTPGEHSQQRNSTATSLKS